MKNIRVVIFLIELKAQSDRNTFTKHKLFLVNAKKFSIPRMWRPTQTPRTVVRFQDHYSGF